jgi:hypothetical protein
MRKLLSCIFTIFLTVSAIAAPTYSANITFSGYNRTETLTNFPVLVAITNGQPSAFSYAQANASGFDIAFVASNGTACNFECDTWNTNGWSYFWVQVPTLTSNQYITMTWGDSALTTQPIVWTNGATWSNGYSAVYHMKAASLTNELDRLVGGSINVTATNGVIGGANGYNGTSSYSAVPATNSVSNLTVTAWALGNTAYTLNRFIATKWNSGTSQRSWIMGCSQSTNAWPGSGATSNQLSCGASADGSTVNAKYTVVAAFTNIDNTWHHNAMIFTNNIIEEMMDGRAGTEWYVVNGTANSLYNYPSNMLIGALGFSNNITASTYWGGNIDEVRVSNVGRSTNWIWAEYFNSASNTTFQSYEPAKRYAAIQFTGYNRSETLTNFPVLVSMANISGFVAGQLACFNACDIRFWSDAALTQPLNAELDTYNGANALLWVQVPIVTNNALIYASWGDSSLAGVTPVTWTNGSVWSNGYVYVSHMETTSPIDKTTNRVRVVNNANTTTNSGVIGAAQEFNGSSAYLLMTNFPNSVIVDNYSVSIFSYSRNIVSGAKAAVSMRGTAGLGIPFQLSDGVNSNVNFTVRDDASVISSAAGVQLQNLNTWNYWAGSRDGNVLTLTFNHNVVTNPAVTYGAISKVQSNTVGAVYAGSYSALWNGFLDEYRISAVTRSTNWLWAEYINARSNSNFQTYGTATPIVTTGGEVLYWIPGANPLTGLGNQFYQ